MLIYSIVSYRIVPYGSRSRPKPHCVTRRPPRKWHSSPPPSAHVYCGHDGPSQLLLN